MFGALAEFEHNLIQERTKAGLQAARARGRCGGRPKALNADQRQFVVNLYNQNRMTVTKLCKTMGISKTTLYDYLRIVSK